MFSGTGANALESPTSRGHVQALLSEDDVQLIRRLGMLTEKVRNDARRAGQLELVTQKAPVQEGIFDELNEVGERTYSFIEPAIIRIACGSSVSDARDRRDILRALTSLASSNAANTTEVATTMAGALVRSGIAFYGTALVAATLFARRYSQATLEETCREWSHHRRILANDRQSVAMLDRTEPLEGLSDVSASLGDLANNTRPTATVSQEQPPSGTTTAPAQQVDIVDCSVFAPSTASPDTRIRIQVFLHLEEQLSKAQEIAQRRDSRAADLGTQTLKYPIQRGAEIDIQLVPDGLIAEETTVNLVWYGRPDSREFIVRLPSDADGHEFLPRVILYHDGQPLGNLTFSILCQQQAIRPSSQLAGRSTRRFQKVFFSYSSKDREKVNVIARSFSLIDQEFFQDILDLDAGERWERKLNEKIDECDLFVLFWSEAAQKSDWVRREVDYALQRERETGAPHFMPFPLGVSPPPQP